MLDGKSIGVVVPAYNEERLIKKTLDTIPEFVDRIIVVNDGSEDATGDIVETCKTANRKITHIKKENNEGLGKAIIDGYYVALEHGLDIVAVMAGDAQMDPVDLERVVRPIVDGEALYVKGNRLLNPGVLKSMPRHRFFGNSVLTILTKFATGYFHLMDPQCGYTAIACPAIRYFNKENPHKGYGYNAHILYQLNLYNMKVVDVDVKPVYGDAISKIRLYKYIPTVSWLLFSIFFRRIVLKYFVFDFHPVGLCYVFGLLTGLISFYTSVLIIISRFALTGPLPVSQLPTIMLCVLSTFSSIMLWLFGMFLDIEYLRTRENSLGVSRKM
jgi:glycosyltransferase involved in cell wall biosynthesis